MPRSSPMPPAKRTVGRPREQRAQNDAWVWTSAALLVCLPLQPAGTRRPPRLRIRILGRFHYTLKQVSAAPSPWTFTVQGGIFNARLNSYLPADDGGPSEHQLGNSYIMTNYNLVPLMSLTHRSEMPHTAYAPPDLSASLIDRRYRVTHASLSVKLIAGPTTVAMATVKYLDAQDDHF